MVVAVAVLPLAALGRGQEPRAAEPRVTPFLRALLEAHNRERLKEGKLPLALSARLVEAARGHARDMAEREKMSHEGSDGSTADERIKRTGYQAQSTAENVAMGHRTIEEVIAGWMHSAGHRRNILGDFREMGGARVVGEDGQAYWTVVFGRPYPTLVADDEGTKVASGLNVIRVEAKKPALKRSAVLDRVAQSLAEALAADPQGPLANQGKAIYERVRKEGYEYQTIGLRIGTGHISAGEFVAGLAANSEGKASLLGEFADVGVGVAKNGDGVPTWVLFLARRQ